MLPPSPHLRAGPMSSPLNFNASPSTSLPATFPRPLEDRDDFFCVDPSSLSSDQLNDYKNEMRQLIDVEKTNLERIQTDSSARLHAYRQGIALAEETMKPNSSATQTKSHSIFQSPFQASDDGPIGCVDPKMLTPIQLQLYIEGIREEINYEEKLTDAFQKESQSRIAAYVNGTQRANDELSIRKSK